MKQPELEIILPIGRGKAGMGLSAFCETVMKSLITIWML
jgi:hypothetical protein